MLAFVAFNFACIVNSTTPAPGEERPKPSLEKWRPKGGTYAEPGVAFNARCGEYGDAQIDWEANAISGGEEGCKIVKLSDTGPAAIRLDVVCTDIERETPYKETIPLKKIDDATIYLRETQNGKFKRVQVDRWPIARRGRNACMPNPERSAIRRLKEVVVDCKGYRFAAQAAVAVSCLLSAITSLSAQDTVKSATEKWRPKDGRYASPGKDFDGRCMEADYFYIELPKRSIGGNEWSCEVKKLTDTAHDTIRLNMDCYDLNLAESLKRPDDDSDSRTFREVMVLKRINDKALSVRKTLNGKFVGSSWQADYCPDDAQRMYIEEKKRAEEEARYKVPEQLLNPKQWRPKDGIYATPDAGFSDRCAKSGDVVVGLIEGSISSGKAECKVVELMSTGQTAVSLTCSPEASKQASSSKKKRSDENARKDPETSSADIIRMSRIDDNTFHMQKTVDRKFKDDGGPVAYCPEEAQRAYAATKAKK